MDLHYTQSFVLLESAQRTTNGVSNAVNVSEFKEGLIFLNVSAVAVVGTFNMKVQVSYDNVTWKDTDYAFATIETLPSTYNPKPLSLLNFGKYIRVLYTIEDSGDYTFEVRFQGKS